MYVCMYVCVYVYVCMRVYVCVHVFCVCVCVINATHNGKRNNRRIYAVLKLIS